MSRGPSDEAPGSASADRLLAPWRARWSLAADGAAFATPSSVLQPVLVAGRQAFLKLATVEEEAAGGRVLHWWRGRGAAPVLAAEGAALLLERATGPRSLAALAETGPAGDDEATRLLCRVVRRLHAVDDRPRPEGLVPLRRWFRELFVHAREHPGGFFGDAAALADELLAEPADDVVLHGDVHHHNVLDFGERGWLAIDPKPVHGAPGFDYANILCNPTAAVALRPGRLERTVAVIAEESGRAPREVLRWGLAWCGLSAAWSERSGGDAALARAAGRRVQELLGC